MPYAPTIPTLAVSMGDPRGIGPEIIVKALLREPDLARRARIIVLGDDALMRAAAAALNAPHLFHQPRREFAATSVAPASATTIPSVQSVPTVSSVPFGNPPPNQIELFHVHAPAPTDLAAAGRASFACVNAAIDLAKRAPGAPLAADAIITAPISKEAWHAAGINYPGHTELLGESFASPRSAMLFVGPTLKVILVTIHIPLRDVPRVITADKVFDAIDLGARACREMGIASPRVGVAGINPHAGEHGLFGTEDQLNIIPAISRARAANINATGPVPGDAVFLQAVKGHFDLVVAMYHDQGLIPVKLLDREHAVNVTVGLEWQGRAIIRTSPAHGTAPDIAGQNKADPSSMIAAMRLAIEMCGQRADG